MHSGLDGFEVVFYCDLGDSMKTATPDMRCLCSTPVVDEAAARGGEA